MSSESEQIWFLIPCDRAMAEPTSAWRKTQSAQATRDAIRQLKTSTARSQN